jgi:hypothetical protein
VLGQSLQAGVTPRDVELNLLNVDVSWASKEEIVQYTKNKNSRNLRWLQRRFPFLFRNVYFAESGMNFHSSFFSLPSNVYLEGFWQCERYFTNIRSVLLKEFTPKNQFNLANAELLSRINSVNSVAVHIRRGDYVTNPQASKFHGILPLSYYERAIKLIEEKIGNPEFFVFSDDQEWVKLNFKIPYPVHFVEKNQGKDAVFDLALMAACRHNVIANSSFSWWGAWLNTNPLKIVIAPHRWFADSSVSSADLLPSSWYRL